jgi:galactokinase
MTVQELKSAFETAYSNAVEAVYFSLGRVNLIGEHTDYNGGPAFPCALSFGKFLLLRKNCEKKINFWLLNEPESAGIKLDELTLPLNKSWVNYPLGVIAQFVKRGIIITQCYDLLI